MGTARRQVFSPGSNPPGSDKKLLDLITIIAVINDVPIPGISDIGDLLYELDPHSPNSLELAIQIEKLKSFENLVKAKLGLASLWTQVQCYECQCTTWFTGFPFYNDRTDFAWREIGDEHWVKCDLSQIEWGKSQNGQMPYFDADELYWEVLQITDISKIKRQCYEQAEKSCETFEE